MHTRVQLFDQKVQRIKEHFDRLMAAPPKTPQDFLMDSRSEISGVYVFSEYIEKAETFLYTGQAVSVLARLREHCAITGKMKANFAYMLTMDTTNRKLIPGSPNATKESMFRDSSFTSAFIAIVDRVKLMNYRYVHVEDKLERHLLEIYASVVLESKYNDFD